MEVIRKKIAELKFAEYNPRRALAKGDAAYEKIKASIETFGMVVPIVWNRVTGNVVAGHQRLQVLSDMGVKDVDVSVISMDAVSEKALNIALNKISGEWDDEKLHALLSELSMLDSINAEAMGFSEEELQSLLADVERELSQQSLSNQEIDPSCYEKDNFGHICPRCGFAFD